MPVEEQRDHPQIESEKIEEIEVTKQEDDTPLEIENEIQ